MKPSYAPIALQPGTHQAGIVSIQVAPKEWLDNNLVQDFATKNVAMLPLKAGKTLINLDFTHPSYEYNEKPKTSKNGAFTEVTLSGLLNYTSPEAAASLETLKYHELIAVVTDSRRQRRIVGDKDFGLTLSFFSKNGNTANASHATEVIMTIEVEEVPPFYGWDITVAEIPIPSTGGLNMEEINYNTGGDTVIDMTATRILKFGNFPIIELWNYNGDNTYSLGNMPIDTIGGTPPSQFIVRNAGGIGKIILK